MAEVKLVNETEIELFSNGTSLYAIQAHSATEADYWMQTLDERVKHYRVQLEEVETKMNRTQNNDYGFSEIDIEIDR